MGFAYFATADKHRTGYFYTDPKTKKRYEIALHRSFKRTDMTIKNTHWYPEEKKIEVATLWAVLRDVDKVHHIEQVPRWAIRRWMNEPWWQNVVDCVVKEKNELLDAKLTDVVHKAVELIQDRIENGDIQKTKDGEEIRVPTRLRDATHALETTFKQRQLLRGEATSRTEAVDSNTKLTQLKDQFEKLAKSKQVNTEQPLEGEYVTVSGTGEGQTEGTKALSEREEPQAGEGRESSGGRDEFQDGEEVTSFGITPNE